MTSAVSVVGYRDVHVHGLCCIINEAVKPYDYTCLNELCA